MIRKKLASGPELTPLEQEFLTAIMETHRDSVLVIDPVSREAVAWNEAFCELTGFRNEEIAAKTVPDDWADNIDVEWAKMAMSELPGKRMSSWELLFKMKSGDVIPLTFDVAWTRPVPECAGFIVAVGNDLRERRFAETPPGESDWQSRLLMENLQAAAWLADRDGALACMSPNVEKISGYPTVEVLAKGWAFWVNQVHPDDQPLLKQSRMGLVSQGRRYELQYRFRTRDRRWIWLSEQASMTIDSRGEPVACGVFSDITRQMSLSEQLRLTERMQIMGELASGVVHDFNNQLTAIIGCSELLMVKAKQQPDVSEYAEHIYQCASHASDLARQLLAFARKSPPKRATFDVHGVIGEVAALLHRIAPERIEMALHLDAESSLVLGDATQIQSALLNLGLNAGDAMPEGGRLTISTSDVAWQGGKRPLSFPALAAGRYLCLAVKDTGVGMDNAIRERMFEPFFTTKQDRDKLGTGMGLSMVLECVRTHQGEIEVITAPGQGTTMILYLPALRRAATALGRIRLVSTRRATGMILVVDDEVVVCRVMAETLRNLGYTVHQCTDGPEALAWYRRHVTIIDLVILDLVMPKMGGRDTFLALREVDRNIKVLLTSGSGSDDLKESMMVEGVKGYLRKPFTADELADAVAKVLVAGS